MGKERKPQPTPPQLPILLHQFLRTQEYAFLMQGSILGPRHHTTAFILKAPAQEWSAIRGTIPVRLSHELYSKPTAPVIRTKLEWYDYAQSHLSFETFTNIEDQEQSILFRRLGRQPDIVTLCYDETLESPIQKRVSNRQTTEVEKIYQLARTLKGLIPDDEYDFDKAKARIMEQYPL